jgi:predicted transcriptional regulator
MTNPISYGKKLTNDEILNDEANKLWEKTHKYSGISKDYFDEYFLDRELGYAIKIKTTYIYKNPLNLIQDFGISVPPQSFMYL